MKFLCLAYGSEDGWNSLTEDEKREVLAQDAVIRDRGNLSKKLGRKSGSLGRTICQPRSSVSRFLRN
jgi:hypothetical protein